MEEKLARKGYIHCWPILIRFWFHFSLTHKFYNVCLYKFNKIIHYLFQNPTPLNHSHYLTNISWECTEFISNITKCLLFLPSEELPYRDMAIFLYNKMKFSYWSFMWRTSVKKKNPFLFIWVAPKKRYLFWHTYSLATRCI